MIITICYVKVACGIHCNSICIIQKGISGRNAVTVVPGWPFASSSSYDAVCIDLPNTVTIANVKVACGIHDRTGWKTQSGICGRNTVTRITATSGHSSYDAVCIDLPNTVIGCVRYIKVACGIHVNTFRVPDTGLSCKAAITAVCPPPSPYHPGEQVFYIYIIIDY